MRLKIDYNVQSNEVLSQHTFLKRILNYYKENDIQQGDPNEGKWEEAHYPLPKHLGGQIVVLLLHEHHQIQGLLQSEESGSCCFFPSHTLRFLNSQFTSNWFFLIDLYEKWASDHGRKSCEKGHEVQRKEGQGFFSEEVQKKAHKKSIETRRKNGTLYTQGYRMDSRKAREVANTLWVCLQTGRKMNAGNLTQYQRRNNIDTSLRKRLSG